MIELPTIIETELGATAVGADAEMLAELLQILEAELGERGAPTEELCPGIEPELLRDSLRAAGLGLPDEVAVLFAWHDGRRSHSANIIPLFWFESSEWAIDGYLAHQRMLTQLLAEDGVASTDTSDYDWGAGEGWLRLWGALYTVAVDCQSDPDVPPLVRSTSADFYDAPPPACQVVSLCTLIAWTIEGLRSGAHQWDAATRGWRLTLDLLPPLQRKYGFF